MKLKKVINNTILEYFNETTSRDTLLDKINKTGVDSLTDFEKNILSRSTEYSNIDDDTIKWLNSNYSDLHAFNEKRKSFGVVKDYLLFMDNDMEMVFEYDKKYKTLYLSYYNIRKYLGDHFNEKSLIKWFKDVYNIEVKEISDYFENID